MKAKVLIYISVLTLLALIAIQAYLIYNSYELKQKTLTIDARNAIATVYNTPAVDSIAWEYRNDFLSNLDEFENEKIDREQLLQRLQEKANEINPKFIKLFDKKLSERNDEIDVLFKKIVTGITVTDTLEATKTIYSEKESDTIVLLGKNFPQHEGILINNSVWQDNHAVLTKSGMVPLDLNFRSSIYMSISNWNLLVLKELAGLLILSAILFLFNVGLLYYSIRNLMKQKRIATVKTDFINNITHELKTPLSTLNLATNTFKSEFKNKQNPTLLKETVEIIERQNTRMQKLIDQVLKSSLGYQQINLSEENFNAAVFLKQLLNDYRLGLEEEIEIEERIESTGVTMKADPFYLGTAIINILNNAIKYGGTKLIVSYEIDVEENHSFTIVDNGIGISQKYQRLIFEKFYRVSERDTHNYKGLGLGLYYTHQIIKAHGGEITVDSNGDEGAVFTIKIPLSS